MTPIYNVCIKLPDKSWVVMGGKMEDGFPINSIKGSAQCKEMINRKIYGFFDDEFTINFFY